jgi:hypothetical protein
MSVTVTLSNVGQPVDIQPPPANQVTDITDLLPQSSSGATTSASPVATP